jgi:hypothetical protein
VVLKADSNYTFVGSTVPATGGVGTPLAGTISGSGAGNTLSFTVSFSQTGGGTVNSITITQAQITDENFTLPVRTIHTVLTPQTVDLSFDGTGYTNIQWFIGDNLDPVATGTSSYTLNSAAFLTSGGKHWITVIVWKGTAPYSKTIYFNVVY